MVCVKCGAELWAGSCFCTRCGCKIENYVDDYETEGESSVMVDDMDTLEYEYEMLVKEKECYLQDARIRCQIKSLQEEIDNILKETENEYNVFNQNTGKENISTTDETTQYCPKCGYYVGTNPFCGRCGNKIRG